MPLLTPGSAEFNEVFHRRFSELVEAGNDPTESAAAALKYVSSEQEDDMVDVAASEAPPPAALETSTSAPAPADGSGSMDEDPVAASAPPSVPPAATTIAVGGGGGAGPSASSMDEDAAIEAEMMEAADAAGDLDEDEDAAAIAMSLNESADPSSSSSSSSSSSPSPSPSSSSLSSSSNAVAEQHDPPEPTVAREKLIDVATLRRLRLEAAKSGDWGPLENLLTATFSDPLVLGASFMVDADADAADGSAAAAAAAAAAGGGMEVDAGANVTGAAFLGSAVDCEAMDAAYAEIEAAEREELKSIVIAASKTAVTSLLGGLKGGAEGGGGPQPTPKGGLRALVLLMANPLIIKYVTPEPQELLAQICAYVAALNLRSRKLLTSWLASEACSNERFTVWLKCLQQFITIACYQASGFGADDLQWVTDAIKAMHILYCANVEAGDIALAAWKEEGAKVSEGVKAPFKAFYNDGINDELFDVENNPQFVRQTYRKWMSDQAKEKKRTAARAKLASGAAEDVSRDLDPEWMPESYISYPFILSPAIKAKVLQLDAQSQMHRGVEAELLTAILSGQPHLVPYLILRVRRSHIIQDTMGQLARAPAADLKKPLKVVFEGEEGIDEGGVQKEFMQVVTRQLLDAQFGMFKINEDSNLMYFNQHTFEIGLEFELIGTLLGVAIYNSIILDIHFPMVVYKRLKGHKPDIHDLTVLDPQLGRNLQKMVDFEGDVEETFGQVFQVAFEAWGAMVTHDLVPNGGDKHVTNDNVQEYVDRYVQWVLVDSVQQQYDAFHKGFMRVCGGQALELFSPRELELLVCGNPVLDFEALERVTQYDDGFEVGSATVRHFWKAVHSFGEEEKRLLLKFSTGSDRAPINGLASMKFVISRNGPDSDRLPTSHTCFNHLLLPEYSSYEKTEEKLICAIRQSEGFGLR